MWQAEANTELTLSALPATPPRQWANRKLTLANPGYNTVVIMQRFLFLSL